MSTLGPDGKPVLVQGFDQRCWRAIRRIWTPGPVQGDFYFTSDSGRRTTVGGFTWTEARSSWVAENHVRFNEGAGPMSRSACATRLWSSC